MQLVEPKVFLIGETKVVEEGLEAYLAHLGVPGWVTDAPSDAERIVEVMGRLCYRSFAPGLNKNVTRVRGSSEEYLKNILKTKHGSVTEHANINFIFSDVSRVFTHELVRHRAGVAISQESLRFVRLDNLGLWAPTVIKEDEMAMQIFSDTFKHLEGLQDKLAKHFKLDEEGVPFSKKKIITSAMRRIAPDGLATTIGWTTNIRALRWILQLRTDPSAEEEIRLVFAKVGEIAVKRYPHLFSDFIVEEVDGLPCYKPDSVKI